MPLAAMLFDMDGTITQPLLDFPTIKREIGLSPESFILEALETMTPAEQQRAMAIVERHEAEAALRAEFNDGADTLLRELGHRGVPTGVITRNSSASVALVVERLVLDFAVTICREHASPKPSPDGIRLALARLGVEPRHAVYVGDHTIDVNAGRAAGTRTIWVSNGRRLTPMPEADYAVRCPGEIIGLLDELAQG